MLSLQLVIKKSTYFTCFILKGNYATRAPSDLIRPQANQILGDQCQLRMIKISVL